MLLVLNDSKHAACITLIIAVFLCHHWRHHPLALESAYEMVRHDNAVAWNAWCEGAVVQHATHGARQTLVKGCTNILVRH